MICVNCNEMCSTYRWKRRPSFMKFLRSFKVWVSNRFYDRSRRADLLLRPLCYSQQKAYVWVQCWLHPELYHAQHHALFDKCECPSIEVDYRLVIKFSDGVHSATRLDVAWKERQSRSEGRCEFVGEIMHASQVGLVIPDLNRFAVTPLWWTRGLHNDLMAWQIFPYYWPFSRGPFY